MTDTLKSILDEVAAGRLDPSEASARIDALRASEAGAGPDFTKAPRSGSTEAAVPEITRVLVRGVSRSVRLIGDPSVTTVSVDGPHAIRRDGATLVVTGENERFAPDEAFSLVSSGRWRELGGWWNARSHSLTVRIRPDLAVGVEITAGGLTAEGAHALDHVRVTAGSAKISNVTEPIDVLVQAGSLSLELRQRAGKSRVRCESGSVKLALDASSDVRVVAEAQLGKVSVEPASMQKGNEVLVGSGTGVMDLEVVMGSAAVVIR